MSEVTHPEHVHQAEKHEIKAFLTALDFPTREQAEKMSVDDWFNVSTRNHKTLEKLFALLDISKFGHIATHGTRTGGLEHLAKNDFIMDIWTNFDVPKNATEALQIAYNLVEHGRRYSTDSNKNIGGIKFIKFAEDENYFKLRFRKQKTTHSGKNGLKPIPDYAALDEDIGDVAYKTFTRKPGDNISEIQFFRDLETLVVTSMGETTLSTESVVSRQYPNFSAHFDTGEQTKEGADALLPSYKLPPVDYRSGSAEDIVMSYAHAFAERVECQAGIKLIVEKFLTN